ncbi:hypothetical protein AOLI_G00161220 [Acnodon oligacanthus]
MAAEWTAFPKSLFRGQRSETRRVVELVWSVFGLSGSCECGGLEKALRKSNEENKTDLFHHQRKRPR